MLATFSRPYYYMDEGNPGIYRPLTSFSLYLNALITGKEAWGFRLGNVLLYAAVCWLIGEVLAKLKVKRAWIWALVFAVLPVHAEAVNNIVGRAEIISLGLVLLAALAQMNRRWELSALVFLLALLAKETAIVGLAILLYLLWIGKTEKEIKMGVSVFYVLVLGSYFVLRLMVLGTGSMGNEATMVENPLKYVSSNQRMMNAFALVPFGLSKIIFPWNLSYDYSFNQLKLATSWFDWRVILGVLMTLGSVGSLLTKLRKNKLWILGQAFFWGPLAVTGNFLWPIGTIFGERLWFWSSLGLIMIIGNPAVLDCLQNRTLFCLRKTRPDFQPKTFRVRKDQAFRLCATFCKSIKYFGFAIITIYAVRTVVRNVDWLTQERLFVHDAAYVTDSVMAQSNAAAMYLMKGDWETGKIFMEKASAVYPKYPELLNNWGIYFLHEGKKDEARIKFEECLAERSGYYLCENNLKLVE